MVIFGLSSGAISARSDEAVMNSSKIRYDCITAVLQLTEAANASVAEYLDQTLQSAMVDCDQKVSLAIRVSPFELTRSSPPRYPVRRQERGEIVSRDESDGRTDRFVLFIQKESPIDVVPFSAANGEAKIFESYTISEENVECLISSLSSDRSSSMIDISLFKLASAKVSDERVTLFIDDVEFERARLGIRHCVEALLVFIRGG
jgi:hypothetical protein